jgi:hypothetical protein
MLKVLQQLAEMPPGCFEPDLRRREEVVRFLAGRPALTHEEWHRRYAGDRGIPLDFVRWFRNACSRHFEYDLSAALPGDGLVEDLGMCAATWADVEWDILEDCKQRYGGELPTGEQSRIATLGEFLEELWLNAQKPTVQSAPFTPGS